MPKRTTDSEKMASRKDRSMPKAQQARGKSAQAAGQEKRARERPDEVPDSTKGRQPPAQAQGQDRAAEAHAANAERRQAKVYQFAGDGSHEPGDVTKVGKAGPGMSTVRYVGGGAEEFAVPNDLLTGPDDDEDDAAPAAGTEPAQPGSDTPQGGTGA